MGTEKTTYLDWDKPVFPSDTLATDLDTLFDQIDVSVNNIGGEWSVSDDGAEVLVAPGDLNFGTGLSATDDTDGSVTLDVADDYVQNSGDSMDGSLNMGGNGLDNVEQVGYQTSGNDFWRIQDGSGGTNGSPLTARFDDRDLRFYAGTGGVGTVWELGLDGSVSYPVGPVTIAGNEVTTSETVELREGTDNQVEASRNPTNPASSPLPAGQTPAGLSSTNTWNDNVYGHSDNSGSLTYEQAVQYAADKGGRLPTLEELEHGVTEGTGSGYDSNICWTQTPAGPKQHYANYGKWSSNVSSADAGRQVLNDTDTAMVRWVADANQVGMAATRDGNGHVVNDNILHAEGTNTNINASNNVSWNTTVLNDSAYSFDGTTATIQMAGTYEIEADADFSTGSNIRSNPNLGVRVNGSWAGVLGRSGYMRNGSGHTNSSVHTRALKNLSSGDSVLIEGIQESSSGDTIVPNRSQFSIKKLNR